MAMEEDPDGNVIVPYDELMTVRQSHPSFNRATGHPG